MENTQTSKTNKKQILARKPLLIGVAFGVVLGMIGFNQFMPSSVEARPARVKVVDPFDLHSWHATGSTWPGSIEFDAKTKSVVLRPVGAQEIKATYSFEIKHASSVNLAAAKTIKGELSMVNENGQKSDSEFQIQDGKYLTLIYKTGQRPEEYVRMNEKDAAEQEKAYTLPFKY